MSQSSLAETTETTETAAIAATAETASTGVGVGDGPLWEMISRLIRERRSNLRIEPSRPVPTELVERLLELACWAPNHMLTAPWRFTIVTGEGRTRLGELAARGFARLGVTDEAVLRKTREKYRRAPVMLVVGSAAHPTPYLHRENRDAVAAGIQNILLAATALGLATYWSTGLTVEVPEAKALVGLQPEDQIIALIYVGWPAAPAPSGRRGTPKVTIVDS